ncbi:MAG: hypothetical protein Q9224_006943, partial [Gallowayella concinna]
FPRETSKNAWSYESTPLYHSLKRSIFLNRAIGKPDQEGDFLQVGGAAFVRWFKGIVREKGSYDRGEEGHLSARRLCTRPVVAETWVGEKAQICWDDQISLMSAAKKRGKANAPRQRRAAEIFRVDGLGEGEKDFFFWWLNSGDVRVNGALVVGPDDDGDDVAVGPLPDFAVIQVENTSIFFWKNASALTFEPASVAADRVRIKKLAEEAERQELERVRIEKLADEAKRQEEERKLAEQQKLDEDLLGQRTEESNSHGDEETARVDEGAETEGPDNNQVRQGQEDVGREKKQDEVKKWLGWYKIWSNKMKVRRAAMPPRPKDVKEENEQEKKMLIGHFVKSSNMLYGDSVLFAIASVWRTLKENSDRRFALNAFSPYQQARQKTKGDGVQIAAAVHGPNELLIPLTFDGTLKESPPNSGDKAEFDISTKDANHKQPLPKQNNPEGDGEYVGKGGHTILVAARRISKDEVRIRIMDSFPYVTTVERIVNS